VVPLAVGSTIADPAERPRPALVLGSLAISSRSTCPKRLFVNVFPPSFRLVETRREDRLVRERYR